MKEISFRGLKIQEGNILKVKICEGVEKEGRVIFKDAAYCLEYYHNGTNRTTPLTNYTHKCEFEIIKQ